MYFQLKPNHQYIMHENEISYIIRGAIFRVFQVLGPGLLESAYLKILAFEIRKSGLNVKEQVALPVVYETEHLDAGITQKTTRNDHLR